MLFIVMALLGSVTVNEVSLDASILDNIQEEWIAPGYEIAKEIIINPLDYGVPQNDRDGVSRIIGFRSFFVQTPEGEKWRIVLTYDRKVVVLQEDAEQREFEVERSIHYIVNSRDGRYVLLRLQEEEDTRDDYERAISGMYYLPLENRSVLIDIDTGTQVSRPGIAAVGYLGGNGYGVASYGDSIWFYDNNLNLLKQVFNRVANVSNGFTAFATDGSKLLTVFSETYDDFAENAVLRAYDNRGSILWDTEPREVGVPAVSADGSLVLVISEGRVLCLDGKDGSLLWEEPFENQVGISCAGRNSASIAFETDLTPEGVRENPGRERFLYVVADIANGNIRFNRISFLSRSIRLFSCLTVNESGFSLWEACFGEEGVAMDLSKYELCYFTETGDLVFVHWINGHGYIRNGQWRNATDLNPYSIDSAGNRIIWFEDSVIHILTLGKEREA